MNTLSWLIYAAGVSYNLQQFMMVATVLCAFCSAGALAFAAIMGDDMMNPETVKRRAWRGLCVAGVLGITSCLIPMRDTIMMIAASEYGEELATSEPAQELGGKAYQALDKFLSSYLEEE